MKTELQSSLDYRISSIDIVRGLIMVIMALDHVRDFVHVDALVFDATNLEKTYPALFFTRWITHFCAPSFVLLSGTAIYLSQERKSKADLSKFLFTRGLWLLFLDSVVMRFIFFFNFYYDTTFLTVLWAIGLSMIGMAAVIRLPDLWALLIGVILLASQHVFPSLPVFSGIAVLPITPAHTVIVSYPMMQWLAIMMIGYYLGKLYHASFLAAKRQTILTIAGLCLIVLFIALRCINVYGDPAPWCNQKNTLFTIMSFINTSKYPPSFLFTMMTLGPVLILLAQIEKMRSLAFTFLKVIGRVPLFYYVLHFFLAHVIAFVLYLINTGKSLSEIDFHFNKSFGGITADGGRSLLWVYVIWIAVVVILYPVCKRYDAYKTTHKKWWLSYL